MRQSGLPDQDWDEDGADPAPTSHPMPKFRTGGGGGVGAGPVWGQNRNQILINSQLCNLHNFLTCWFRR
jgi:hypothetical protein